MSSPLLLERTVRIHEALERAGFAHAIGGALALGYHVEEPRATRDIDLNVSADPACPQLLFDALPPSILWTGVDVDARCAMARYDSSGQVQAMSARPHL